MLSCTRQDDLPIPWRALSSNNLQTFLPTELKSEQPYPNPFILYFNTGKNMMLAFPEREKIKAGVVKAGHLGREKCSPRIEGLYAGPLHKQVPIARTTPSRSRRRTPGPAKSFATANEKKACCAAASRAVSAAVVLHFTNHTAREALPLCLSLVKAKCQSEAKAS
jgi:hypothetical protein